MNRCAWPNLEKYETYREYHDNEWGQPSYDDLYLFEMIVLQAFHCGLSWLIILNKREAFRQAFDQFDPQIVKRYDEDKIIQLLANKDIVRNVSKIRAAINNAARFIEVQEEFGSFCDYIWGFTGHQVLIRQTDDTICSNALSDQVAKDMKKRGFKYMGSVTTFSYLEAIGVMNNHSATCYKGELHI